MTLSIALTLSIFFSVSVSSVWGSIKVNIESKQFVDEKKRSKIFHGVNAVYKVPPYYPQTEGFDVNNSLSEIDSKNLRSWGFNVVRLGVMWPGVEPTVQGAYDYQYLQQIETIVKTLAKDDIYVILDFHQDLWHRKFCGEGVPDYIYDICSKEEPSNIKEKPFPMPVVNSTYPLDDDGNPSMDACLSKNFVSYYMSAEVGAAFQCLYDNKGNLWTAFGNYWKVVAERFKSYDNVLGYELMNEPWAGDVYSNHKVLLPGFTERNFLQPLYEYLHQEIRSVDNEKIIFFEGLTIDYWQNGFEKGPGNSEYNDRQVLAYHIYCPLSDPSVKKEILCNGIDDEFFLMRRKDANRLGTAMVMTEFGATEDIKGDLYNLEKTAELADKHQQSWMYWEFKYYHDITTITPQGETLYSNNDKVSYDKLAILSRTYPQTVAGTIVSYNFNKKNAFFELKWNGLPEENFDIEDEEQRTTRVYFFRDLYYEKGIAATVNSDDIKILCPSSLDDVQINVVQNNVFDGQLTITLSPCKGHGDEDCTCPF